jgi:hypothetical protein
VNCISIKFGVRPDFQRYGIALTRPQILAEVGDPESSKTTQNCERIIAGQGGHY